jgi:hypothetical protein
MRVGNLNFSRRQLISGLTAAGALAALPVRAQVPMVMGYQSQQDKLLELARRELERAGSSALFRDRVGLVDFSKVSAEPRFHIVDMERGDISTFHVTHGRGSDWEHDGWLKRFSNVPGSLATSRGAYVTSDYYWGKHGSSMRLEGIDADNNNAMDRAIVVHGAWYADPALIAEQGRLGRSEGCFVFAESLLPFILYKMGPGRLMFADRFDAAPPPPSDIIFVDGTGEEDNG